MLSVMLCEVSGVLHGSVSCGSACEFPANKEQSLH